MPVTISHNVLAQLDDRSNDHGSICREIQRGVTRNDTRFKHRADANRNLHTLILHAKDLTGFRVRVRRR